MTGEELRRLREGASLSQAKLARRMHLSRAAIWQFENDLTSITEATAHHARLTIEEYKRTHDPHL